MTDSIGTPWLWAGFIVFVFAMLALDLGVFHRKHHTVGFREAAIWSTVWITLSVIFGFGLWWKFGQDHGLEFLTGYVVEKSLSVDNLFVFLVVFSSFKVPPVAQHRVLFWGILGALVLRGIMIFAGVALLHRFSWLIFIFGGFLIITGVRLFVNRNKEDDPQDGRVVRWIRKVVPTAKDHFEDHFFVKQNGKRLATPLFVALLVVEASDVLFAVDSIPAVFAVTTDPFIVFTSNIFAIMGLRSLFFLLAGLLRKFTHLKPALAGVLVFVGVKMVISKWVHLHPAISLGVIAAILTAGIVASMVMNKREAAAGHQHG